MSNGATTFAAALAAVVLAAWGGYLAQHRQVERLKADNRALVLDRQQSAAARERTSRDAQTAREQLARLQQDRLELLRLRKELGQLRRERGAQPPSAPPSSSPQVPAPPAGRYIPISQLVFAGYATPEAALQSHVWALLSGDYDQLLATLSAQQQQRETNGSPGSVTREAFADASQSLAFGLQGLQIAALKPLADDRVELKARIDGNPAQLGLDPNELQKFQVIPMIRTGNDWKVAGYGRDYDDSWDRDGSVQPLTQ